jgi:nucleoside-diphosphate-sugar epimerase
MAKKILVIGGSYFAGRVFSMYVSSGKAGDYELYVLNRGNAKLGLQGANELVCDRHDIKNLIGVLPDLNFDAVVDFCAYEPNDIAPIIEALSDKIGQYIYISTASVYANEDRRIKYENDERVHDITGDEVKDYVAKKSILEDELSLVAGQNDIPYTIIRPSFIYGPFNYAPRESWFIKKIALGEDLPKLIDGTASFNFVFVIDLAKAIAATIGQGEAYNEAFNITAPEAINNEIIIEELRRLSPKPFNTYDVTVQEVLDKGIELPFPLTDDELFNGDKFRDTFGFSYTPFGEGFNQTIKAFMNVFKQ